MGTDRDEILGLTDVVIETVDVPEWKRAVRVRSLTAAERESWEGAVYPGPKETRVGLIRAALAVRSIIDEQGNRIFGDDDAESLATKSAAALERVYRVARRLSFVTDSDVEELLKN